LSPRALIVQHPDASYWRIDRFNASPASWRYRDPLSPTQPIG
jgi:hypothetical protein